MVAKLPPATKLSAGGSSIKHKVVNLLIFYCLLNLYNCKGAVNCPLNFVILTEVLYDT